METNRVLPFVEKYLWNNLRMYLMTYPTCLLDNLLEIKDNTATSPVNRYNNFLAELDRHIGLGSYTNTQPTQFSTLPFVTVNVAPIGGENCNTRALIGFDIAFATDTPEYTSVGNTNEAVASFRANMLSALDEIMYDATDTMHYNSIPFFDRLRDADMPNPVNNGQIARWKYNIIGQVDAQVDISEVSQIKREDRSSGISVFSAIYGLDINCLYDDNSSSGCC